MKSATTTTSFGKCQQRPSLESMNADVLDKYTGLALKQLSSFEEFSDDLEWRISATLAKRSGTGTTKMSLQRQYQIICDTYSELMFLFDQNARLHAGGDTLGPKTLQLRVSRCIAVSRGLITLCTHVREEYINRHDQLVEQMKGLMNIAVNMMRRSQSKISSTTSSSDSTSSTSTSTSTSQEGCDSNNHEKDKDKEGNNSNGDEDEEQTFLLQPYGMVECHAADTTTVHQVWEGVGIIQQQIAQCDDIENRLDLMCKRINRSVDSQRVVIADNDKNIDVEAILKDLERTRRKLRREGRKAMMNNMVRKVVDRFKMVHRR